MIQTAASSAGAVRRLSLSEVWLVDRGFMCSCGLEKKMARSAAAEGGLYADAGENQYGFR
jgi:hypothetical protein